MYKCAIINNSVITNVINNVSVVLLVVLFLVLMASTNYNCRNYCYTGGITCIIFCLCW